MTEIHVSGLDPFEQKVQRLALFMQDLRSFWPLVVPLFVGWMKQQFDSEGAFAGAPWAPLTPDYAARKAALGLRSEILQAKGDLRQAASRPTRSVTPRTLTLSIDDPKLPWLQEGTTRMVARPLVFGDPLPAEAERDLQAAATGYVEDLLLRF